MVWDEVLIIEERVNARLSTEAILVQSAVASILSKDGNRQFQKIIKKLTEGYTG